MGTTTNQQRIYFFCRVSKIGNVNRPFGTGVYQLFMINMVIWGMVQMALLNIHTIDVSRGIVEIYDNGIDWDEFDHRRTMRSLE